MVTAAYKKKLIEKIKNTNDESILREVEKCLSQQVYTLSEDELKSISEGEQDVFMGEVLSAEDASKQRSSWL